MYLQKSLHYKLLLLFVILCSTRLSFCQNISVDFYPEKDNTMFSESNTTSDGSGKNIFAGKTEGNLGTEFRRALVKFAITGIPSNAVIQSVTLTLSVMKASSPSIDHNVSIYKVLKNWGEGASIGLGKGAPAKTNDATWKYSFYTTQSWTNLGGDFVATSSGTTSVHYDPSVLQYAIWSSTAMLNDVKAWIANPATNYGWIFIGDESTDGSAKRFSSREETIYPKPTLTITYSIPVEEKVYINEVSPSQKWVELYNPANPTIDLSTYWLANGTNNTSIATVSPLNGDLSLDSAEYVILPVSTISSSVGELALYKGQPSTGTLKAYLQYGAANQNHAANAVSALVWNNTNSFIFTFADSTKSYSVNTSSPISSGKDLNASSWLIQKQSPEYKNNPCPPLLNLRGNLLNGAYQSEGLQSLSHGTIELNQLRLTSEQAIEIQAPQQFHSNTGQITLHITGCTY